MAVRLILVRHGQASFESADYDRLSGLGYEQSRILGKMLHAAGVTCDFFWRGALRRHAETLEGITQGLEKTVAAEIDARLDEFDSDALVKAWGGEQRGFQDGENGRVAHFRDLRQAMLAWQQGEVSDAPETWAEFKERVQAALDNIRMLASAANPDATVLAVSSGGPISMAVMLALHASSAVQADLQMQLQNASLTRLVLTGRGPILQSFNENWLASHDRDKRLVTYS